MRRVSCIAAVVGLLLACSDTTTDDNNFRQDVIYCEEALATLAACCNGFDPTRVACQYHYSNTDTSGCGGTVDSENPALSLPESQCILSTPCSQLQADHVCARAQVATEYTNDTTTTSSGEGTQTTVDASAHAPVCP